MAEHSVKTATPLEAGLANGLFDALLGNLERHGLSLIDGLGILAIVQAKMMDAVLKAQAVVKAAPPNLRFPSTAGDNHE